MEQIINFIQATGTKLYQAQILSSYESLLPLLKLLGLVLTIFFIGFTIYSMVKTGWLALRINRIEDAVLKIDISKKRTLKVWKNVERYFFSGSENDLKMAIIEADKILDDALRVAGFRGETLGERLKKITSDQLSTIEEIWEAHKLRNRLTHEPGFKLNREVAEKILSIYEKTMVELGILDTEKFGPPR